MTQSAEMQAADWAVQFRRADGTFVILLRGLPYHVIQDDPLFPEVALAGVDAPFEPEITFPEPSPVPMEVSRFQARAGLLVFGVEIGRPTLLDEVDAMIGALGGAAEQLGLSAVQVRVIQEAWANAQVIRRDSPALNMLFPALGLDLPEHLDRLFIIAATQAA